MTHASLFSGIGGAELAASWMGWNNIFHCEINPFGRKVLEYWFPKSKSYEDIKTTDFREWREKVDILTGGFPCQPFSQAGKRGGDTDDRYLWPEMLRAIREVHPTWVVGENVSGITSMVESSEDVEMGRGTDIFEESIIYRKEQKFTIKRICEDFESIGYAIQPVLIPACAVGAPHRRDRVWFIAHCNDTGIKSEQGWEKLSHESESITDTKSVGSNNNRTKYIIKKNNKKVWPELQRKTYRFSDEQPFAHTDSNGLIERNGENEKQPDKRGINAQHDSQQIFTSNPYSNRQRNRKNKQEQIKELERETDNCVSSEDGFASNTKSTRSKGKLFKRQKEIQPNRQNSGDIQTGWPNFPTQPPVCRGNDGLPFNVDNLTIPFPRWRQESIKAYGNAWVPQVSFEIFKMIDSYDTKRIRP